MTLEEKQRSPDAAMTWLDRSIAWISPKLGYARMAWRQAVRGWNAGEVSRNSAGWVPVNAKAEQLNQPRRDLIRAKGRDAERNSDIIGGPIGTLERNVVATGFRLQADTGDETLNAAMESTFSDWSKPQNCDITGAMAMWEMEKLAIRRTEVDGGILFLKTYNNGNKRFPFQLQAREVDDLDSMGTIRNGANVVINGIEVNSVQKPVAYFLKQFSPDGWFTGKCDRVTADRVISLWKKTLPSQIREVSLLAPALNRSNDLEEYLDAVSMKEKILACLSIFIKRLLPVGSPGRSSTSIVSDDYDQKTGYKRKKVSPGMIMDLQPGDDVSAVVPTGQAANAREMTTLYQRLIGAGQGLSYETSSRDMSQVNYSSARQGLLEDQRTYEDWQQWLIDHFLSEVYTEVIISAVLSGELVIPDFWQNKNKYLKHRWIPPGWSWIDPLKEITANKIGIETGQQTLANVCAQTGYDWRQMMEQRAKELAYRKELEQKYGVTMTEGGNPIANTQPSTEVGQQSGT